MNYAAIKYPQQNIMHYKLLIKNKIRIKMDNNKHLQKYTLLQKAKLKTAFCFSN